MRCPFFSLMEINLLFVLFIYLLQQPSLATVKGACDCFLKEVLAEVTVVAVATLTVYRTVFKGNC